jgi:hypothetical protein
MSLVHTTPSLLSSTEDEILKVLQSLPDDMSRHRMLNDLRVELGRITPSLECPNPVPPPPCHGAPLGGYTAGTSLHHIWLDYSTLLWHRKKYLESLSSEVDAVIAANASPVTPDTGVAGFRHPRAMPRVSLPRNPADVLAPLVTWTAKHKATRCPDMHLLSVPGLERNVRQPDGTLKLVESFVPAWASEIVAKVSAYQEELKSQTAAALAKAEEDRIQKEVAARLAAIKQAEAAAAHAKEEAARKAAFEAEVERRVLDALRSSSLVGGGGATSSV